MNNLFNNCPRCGNITNQVSGTCICKCGWSRSSKVDDTQKNVVSSLFLIAAFVGILTFHLFQWGGYSLSILISSPEENVTICMDLKKYDCVEKAYQKIFDGTKQQEHLEQLAEFQFKREKYDIAQQNYKIYFSRGGGSEKAIYYYAHSLAKVGEIDKAIPQFEALMKKRPGTLMVTVVESYLQILVSYNRVNKAKEVLSWARNTARNSNAQRHVDRWKKQFKI